MSRNEVKWSSTEIRKTFLDYFKKLNHTVVPSSTLIPLNDPTLLFTNAGMNQFKEVFLGDETRAYTRATSIQRCVRAGGKHNDLENVGYTKRHHTFFEMLGNFSFGDYFKKEAIQFAWDFLTKVLEIPAEKLWVTVFREDRESESIWLNDIKVDPERFTRCGERDNFWSMGEVGPCGPCTEIFYDHGPSVAGGPPGSPDAEGDRYVEIWNLVFMQYNRDIGGELSPLPKPCVDTGMGLERIAAVMQGVHDNYDIDTFQHLLVALGKLVHSDDYRATAMRVIVDHIRSASFLIADGVTPSNEGRGYVLRRIIRRAARYGFKLEQQEPFFYQLVDALVNEMGDTYPVLLKTKALISQVIEHEEKQFSHTLSKGLKILDKKLSESKTHEINGELMFQLYDTHGFPIDLIIDIAKERNLTWDGVGFEKAMSKQREQSQQFAQFHPDQIQQLHISGETIFTGYEKMIDDGKVVALLSDFKPVNTLKSGEKGVVVLNQTPFYAESGGQVGDTGYLYFPRGSFRVHNTQKKGAVYLHFGTLIDADLTIDTIVRAEVDQARNNIKLNHSATHLLHEALRRVLGEHVSQKGSLVEAQKFRFDFSHLQPMTQEQIHSVERLVNQQIRLNLPSHVEEKSLDEAKSSGAMALFSEKYADQVRVVKMGDFSLEICGGTHVERSGEIGLFKIVSEMACAAGIRRIEAVTGQYALEWVEENERRLHQLSDLLKTNAASVTDKLSALIEQNKALSKEISSLKQRSAQNKSQDLISEATTLNDTTVLIATIDNSDRDMLRNMIDDLKQRIHNHVILLASVVDAKVILICAVHKGCAQFTAPELLKVVAQKVGGTGGGRPDLAQGGGDQPLHLQEALSHAKEWITHRLENH